MGLQLYRDPDEVDAENAVAAKVELQTAQRRSPIRREPPIRPSRENLIPGSSAHIIRYRHEMRQTRMRTERDLEESDAQIEALEAEVARLRRLQSAHGRAHPRTVHRESRVRPTRTFEMAPSDRDTNSVSHDVFLAEDPGDPTSPELHSSENVILPRPIHESNLRFQVEPGADLERSTSFSSQRLRIPSPPYSLRGSARTRPVDGPLPDTWETTPPLTHDFAPARAARAAAIASNNSPTAVSPRPSATHRAGLDTPPPEAYDGSSRLRRMPHLSPQLLPRTTVDGLGDRHRSPSGSLELLEEESWNNLLATMETRPLPASATTSMTESFPASRTNSQQSGATSTTSFGEIGLSAEETCDLPPGITEDDVRSLRERHQRDIGRVRAPRRYARHTDEHGEGSDSALSILIREARDSQERLRRRRELMGTQYPEFRQNREHVPEDWWALAGLPTVLGSPPAES